MLKAIEAGQLRHKLIVQTSTITGTTPLGEPVVMWKPTATVPAYVEELSGRKLELSRQLVPLATHSIVMRYLPLDVNTNNLVYGTTTIGIGQSINVLGQNLQLQILGVAQL